MKITRNNIGEYLLDELLAVKGMTIEDAKADDQWFSRHSWTYEESRDFINKHSPIVKKVLRCNNDRLEKEWAWFMLQFGWKYSTYPNGEQV